MNTKVIAIGNILMGDDGMGIRVLNNIDNFLNVCGIETYAGETDFLSCISVIDEGDFIIILDAAMTGKNSGDITIIPLEVYKYNNKLETEHSNNLLDMLYTYHKNVKGYVIGIEIENIVYNLEISRNLKLHMADISFSVLRTILNLVFNNQNI